MPPVCPDQMVAAGIEDRQPQAVLAVKLRCLVEDRRRRTRRFAVKVTRGRRHRSERCRRNQRHSARGLPGVEIQAHVTRHVFGRRKHRTGGIDEIQHRRRNQRRMERPGAVVVEPLIADRRRRHRFGRKHRCAVCHPDGIENARLHGRAPRTPVEHREDFAGGGVPIVGIRPRRSRWEEHFRAAERLDVVRVTVLGCKIVGDPAGMRQELSDVDARSAADREPWQVLPYRGVERKFAGIDQLHHCQRRHRLRNGPDRKARCRRNGSARVRVGVSERQHGQRFAAAGNGNGKTGRTLIFHCGRRVRADGGQGVVYRRMRRLCRSDRRPLRRCNEGARRGDPAKAQEALHGCAVSPSRRDHPALPEARFDLRLALRVREP